MAQEMVDLVRIQPAVAHQLGVLVNADVEQMRQQADILAQRQRAIGLGLVPGRVIQMALLAVSGQAQLHAHGVVTRERALMHPFQFQPNALRCPRQRTARVAQQQGARAIRQHPAQEVRVKVRVIATRREARTLEQARRQFAGHGQGAGVSTHLHALRGHLDRRHARRANPMHRQRFHRLRGKLALDHVRKARHQRVAARRAAGQQGHGGQVAVIAPQAVADGVGRQLRVRVDRLAFRVDGVVALLDAILGKDAALDAAGHSVQRRNVAIHGVVGHGFARHEITGAFQVDTIKRDGHVTGLDGE
ncbi:hypothetical protein D3C86_981440 [compost metagenome]